LPNSALQFLLRAVQNRPQGVNTLLQQKVAEFGGRDMSSSIGDGLRIQQQELCDKKTVASVNVPRAADRSKHFPENSRYAHKN
jgi:hypothetical protein